MLSMVSRWYTKILCSYRMRCFIKRPWFVVLIFCFIGSFQKIIKFCDLYLEYSVIITIRVDHKQDLKFPAVTVCNLNRMKELIGSLEIVSLIGHPPLVLSERKALQHSGKPEQREQVKFLQEYYKMSEKERFRAGHQPKDFLQKCLFNGRHCSGLNLHNFTSFRFGNCVTFNKRISSSKPLRTSKTGVGAGLIMNLNLEIDFYSLLTHTIGAKVVIHEPSDVPNLEEEGFILSPGYESLISLKQTVFRRLPAPYKDKCFDYKNQVNPAMTSKNMCVRECMQEKNFAECGCVDFTLAVLNDLRPCDWMNETEIHCLDDVLTNMSLIGSNCKCPLPCTSIFYNEMISRAYMLPKIILMKNNRSVRLRRDSKFSEENLRVNIFYSNLEQTFYEQKPKWEEIELICNLGNQLGLWLGLCFATFIGISEKLFLVLMRLTFYRNHSGR